jgi:energy-coupling factor transporter ATP-binding protein EcfA2
MRALPDDLICRASLLKLQLVGLSAKDADKMPSDLSGGMIKRVGLARALALEPELVFLDEPTAGLDPMASDDYVALIRELRRELGLTVVMITHDLDTLVALSDRVAVLADHRVLAAAPIPEVIKVDHPFIREYFLGERAQRALQALPAPKRPGAPARILEKSDGKQVKRLPGRRVHHRPCHPGICFAVLVQQRPRRARAVRPDHAIDGERTGAAGRREVSRTRGRQGGVDQVRSAGAGPDHRAHQRQP